MSLKKRLFWLIGIICFSTIGLAVGQESTPSNDSLSFRELLINVMVEDEVSTFKKYPEVKDGGYSYMALRFLEKYKDLQDVTVTALDKAYNQNEIKADMQYKDKPLIVTGKVASIDKSFGSPVLQLRTNNPYLSVNAFFKKSKSKSNELELTLAEFKKGQSVSLICRGDGKLMVPVLRDCELLNPLIDKEGEVMRKEWLDAVTRKGNGKNEALMAFIVLYLDESLGPKDRAACTKSTASCLKIMKKNLAKINKAKKGDIKPPQAYLDLGYTMGMLNQDEEKKDEAPAKPLSASELQKSCEAGKVSDCVSLGQLYRKGDGVAKSYPDAKKYFELACQKNDGEGCMRFGRLYEYGEGVDQSFDEARKLFDKAIELGYAGANTNIGYMYEKGKGVQQSIETAVEYYKKACDANDDRGCNNLGVYYNKVEKAPEKAYQLFVRACDLGLGMACSNIGGLYYQGQGVKQSKEDAIKYFEKACGLDFGPACGLLGNFYRDGEGVEKSLEKAKNYFEKGCDLDAGIGCLGIASMYFRGDGVPASKEKSFTFYEKACDLDTGWGCQILGLVYDAGDGVPKSDDKAREYYEKACSLDVDEGCEKAGSIYYTGRGVEKSDERACEFFEKACNLGSGNACQNVAAFAHASNNEEKTKEFSEKACKLGNEQACQNLGIPVPKGQDAPSK